MLFIGIITGLIILVLLVVLHELGHAIVARRNGVVVEEFGIGFPPRAWGKKLKNGILFSLNWLPLGGFVKLQGEHDAARGKGDYGAASYWQKTKILLAGVLINWLTAWLLLTGLALTGLPKIFPHQFSLPGDTTTVQTPVTVAAIASGSAAETAGLQQGDEIVSIDQTPMKTTEQLTSATRANAGQTVALEYRRNGAVKTVDVQLGSDPTKGALGAGIGQREFIKSTWSAPIVGLVTTAQFTYETLKGLGTLVVDVVTGFFQQLSGDQAVRDDGGQKLETAKNSVAGPVGILGTIFPNAQAAGSTQLIFLTAIISLTLAVMNTLPIPGLDGGRWFTITMFRLLRKKLTKEREESIQAIGFMVLFGLIILITVLDVTKLF